MIDDLMKNFGVFLRAPDGPERLRELILTLAAKGSLTSRVAAAESAADFLSRIRPQTTAEREQARGKRASGEGQKGSDAEPPFELPDGWRWCRLEEVASYIQRGKGPRYADHSDIHVVSQKCVQWSGFDITRARYIDPETFSSYGSDRVLRAGDLLWNSTGTGTIGRVNVYPDEASELSKAVADSHVTVVRLIEVNPDFLWLWLASPYVQETIEAAATGSTNQIELATSRVKSQIVPLAPLEEQDAIVVRARELLGYAGELATKIAENRQLNADLAKSYVHHVGTFGG